MGLKALSVGVVLLILYGYARRREPRVHIPVMLSAFVIDMSIVAYIEGSREAVRQAMGPTSPLMKLHLACSILTLALYLVQIGSGILKARGVAVPFHRQTGLAFLLFRVGNLVTSFLIPTHNLSYRLVDLGVTIRPPRGIEQAP